jgi:putative transposase
VYHVTSRGNGRAAIYLDDGDREAFLNVFGEVCGRIHWVCYAYCLMTSHYHLVIETLDPNLSRGMRQLNGVYTQQFNQHHGRVGHVFQGRYKAILIDREPYLLHLVRYVVLNPVRAGMVTSPEPWRWSRDHAAVGQAHTPDWLATEWVLRQFGTRRAQAHQRFAQFVRDGQTQPSIWHELRNQIYLGDEQFVARMQSQIQDEKPQDDIPKVQRRLCRLSLEDFARQHGDPQSAMAAAYVSGTHTMNASASYFGVHYSTVSRAVSRAEGRRGT